MKLKKNKKEIKSYPFLYNPLFFQHRIRICNFCLFFETYGPTVHYLNNSIFDLCRTPRPKIFRRYDSNEFIKKSIFANFIVKCFPSISHTDFQDLYIIDYSNKKCSKGTFSPATASFSIGLCIL